MSLASEPSSDPLPSITTNLRPDKRVVDENGEAAETLSPRSPTYSPCQSTLIELVSISATSSAFPESFGMTVSPKGRCIIAYSSAALYIILSQHLPAFQQSCRAFRLRRRPLAVAVTDLGKYAVLSSPYKLHVYECGDGSRDSLSQANKKLQTISLNIEARTLAFSANGELVVAGSEHGIEIVGLALPEGSDRRQINCGSVDLIVFSDDGKSLLATTPARRSRTSTFMTITGAFDQAMLVDDDEEQEHQPIGKLWISQLIFPERLPARQSVFLPDLSNGQAGELLAFDAKTDRFGIFDAALKTFTGKTLAIPEEIAWSRSDRFEDTLPGVSPNGSCVAIAVRLTESSEIWTYRISSCWRDDDSPSGTSSPCLSSSLAPLQRLPLPPRADNLPPENITCLRWLQLQDTPVDRLLALVNTVALSMPEDGEPTAGPAASGKILVFDFKKPADSLSHSSATVSIDLDQFPLTEELAEEEVELEREVDLVRRRTQVQRNNRREANTVTSPRLRRSMSSSSHNSNLSPLQDVDLHSSRVRRRRSFSSISDVSEDAELSPGVAVDEPYSQSAPRPQFMLTRAATVAQNAPAARLHLRALPSRPLEYRRADGMREVPHESDADDWVPPPPPYSERPDAPGPNAVSLPITTIPGMAERVLQGSHVQENRQRNPRGMRSRVSQVISSVQVPILPTPPSSSSRLSALRPTNTGQGNAPSQNVFAVSVQPPRSQTTRITRRPLSSSTQAPPSRPPIPPSVPLPQRMPPSSSSAVAPPAPGSLNSPHTFPLPRRARGTSNSHLSIPQMPMPQSASAPVTPITNTDITPPRANRMSQQYTSPQTPMSLSIVTTPRPAMDARSPSASRNEALSPPSAPFANTQSRRVSSVEYMGAAPSSPAGNSSLVRHSSDFVRERPQRMSNSSGRATSWLSNSQQSGLHESSAEPANPTSRWQRRRIGSTPTRATHVSNVASTAGSRAVSQPVQRDREKSSKCIVQ